MKKIQIKIILIGHLRHSLNLRKIKQFQSRFFEINEIEKISNLPAPKKDDGFLNIEYSREEIKSLLDSVNSAKLVIGIINYRFNDNFYMHRTGNNKLCISIADIDSLLLENNISLENFIMKNIFEVIVLKNTLGTITSDDIYNLAHQDTRGCLFDLNGDKYDVIFNTEKPIICDSCKAFINSKSLPQNFIKNIERELKKIKKPIICTIELFIKKYPLFSVLLALLTSIIINIMSNIIWELLK
jgi:hypothetical protein